MRISDWSSDVCSSDLDGRFEVDQFDDEYARYVILSEPDGTHLASARLLDRQSVVAGKSVSVRVALGGRRLIKKNKQTQNNGSTALRHIQTHDQQHQQTDIMTINTRHVTSHTTH